MRKYFHIVSHTHTIHLNCIKYRLQYFPFLYAQNVTKLKFLTKKQQFRYSLSFFFNSFNKQMPSKMISLINKIPASSLFKNKRISKPNRNKPSTKKSRYISLRWFSSSCIFSSASNSIRLYRTPEALVPPMQRQASYYDMLSPFLSPIAIITRFI